MISILGVTTYSRKPIEIMSLLVRLRWACDEAILTSTWLSNEVASRVPVHLQQDVVSYSDTIASMFPNGILPGFETDFTVSMLYRVRPPVWFNDGLIQATCERLQQSYKSIRFAGIPTGYTNTARHKDDQGLSPYIMAHIAHLSAEPGVSTVLLPVNYGNTHWCGIMISVEDKTVTY